MTDSELLDRRIEQLVVSTVHRELRRKEEQDKRIADKVNEHTADAVAYSAKVPARGLFTLGGRQVEYDMSRAPDETLEAHVQRLRTGDNPVEGLTVAVLLESLRRANERAGQYARDFNKTNADLVEIRSRHETASNTLQRKVKQIEEVNKTCVRLVDERDRAQRELARMSHELEAGGKKFMAAVDEREQFRRWWEDRREACKNLEGVNRDLAELVEKTHRELEALRNAYNELAKATA